MEWIQVCITTTTAGIEPVSGRLYQLGIKGVEIEDKEDFAEFLDQNTPYWDMVDEDLMAQMRWCDTRVKAYICADETAQDTLSDIRASMLALAGMDEEGEFGSLTVECQSMNEEDWANNWKQYFKPLNVGEKVRIVPEWENTGDTQGRTVFVVNPGMTFGTGTHHSTRLCIEELEQVISGGETMIDIGCGSGILSIIGLQLGVSHAEAVDIDPNAVHTAYENAERNGIGKDRYHVCAGNVLTDTALVEELAKERYDIVAANIVADVIIALLPTVKRLIKPGGVFVCSGIITERQADVEKALAAHGFSMDKVRTSADWCAIRCTHAVAE